MKHIQAMRLFRRDLTTLEKSGLLKRIHGGATLVDNKSIEPSQHLREMENSEKKAVIAMLAAECLYNNSSVFLDSSTTNRHIVPLLKRYKGMTYITNSYKTASELAATVSDAIYLAGGRFNDSLSATNGILTCEFLERWNSDFSCVACRGVSVNGCTVVNAEQARIKEIMIKNSKISLLLCDSSKFGKVLRFNRSIVDWIAILWVLRS